MTCGLLKRCAADRCRPLAHAFAAFTVLVTISSSAKAQARFDVNSLPRPLGSEVILDGSSSNAIEYNLPAPVKGAIDAVDKSLSSEGWKQYRTPDQEASGTILRYKNGMSGIYVSFSMLGGKLERSRVSYRHNNSIPANLPFPEDAADIVYDENRPYLRCVTSLTFGEAIEFFTTRLTTEQWSVLRPDDIRKRWPHANLMDATDTTARMYFERFNHSQQQLHVVLTMQRTETGKTLVDVRIAPFVLPNELSLYREFAGLPAPERTKIAGGTGSPDSIRRESTALVIAEIPAVLSFYRREMTSRGWKEQDGDASVGDTKVNITFLQPDGSAVLELGQHYDLTRVRLIAQLSEAAITERARAKKVADSRFMTDALRQAQDIIAHSEHQRKAAVQAAAAAPVEAVRPLANASTPIPVPENAKDVQFDGTDGRLDYASPSNVKSVAAFYRNNFKAAGWKEKRSVIDRPTIIRMDFAKGPQTVGLTVMQFGSNTKVSASGSGLQVPPDLSRETERLEAAETSGFPVPKNHTLSAPSAWTMKGRTTPFRREFNARVPSDIGSVLAFYRRELEKRGWREKTEATMFKAETVQLTFNAPDGPATLMLGRERRETTVTIVIKNPAEAGKAGVLPTAGKTKVIFENLGDVDASIIIANKTVKIAQNIKTPDKPKGRIMELPPGKYKYVLKVAGKPNEAGEIVAGADDAWALLIGPGGVLPMQMY